MEIFIDLFIAGVETTSTSMTWLTYLMIYHPEVQDKIHEEMDRVLGDDKNHVNLSDRDNLPYLNAVIMEAHR